MGEQSSTMRGDTSSVAGGGSQRFRWAAKESAPNEFNMAELELQLAQDRVAIKDAQLNKIINAKMRAARAGDIDSSTTFEWSS